ncbi:rRNA-processing protein EBP2 [Marasmius crinis-equi]|uniref:rRNA-processing protein EBP2 n=1 Tax=Marasmius crinis-equi TaxID=585013 RepID=A0ABR3FQL0_9AGAR
MAAPSIRLCSSRDSESSTALASDQENTSKPQGQRPILTSSLKGEFQQNYHHHGALRERRLWLRMNASKSCVNCSERKKPCVHNVDFPRCEGCRKYKQGSCSLVADERKDRMMRLLEIDEATFDALLAWYEKSVKASSEDRPAPNKTTARKTVKARSVPQPRPRVTGTPVKKPTVGPASGPAKLSPRIPQHAGAGSSIATGNPHPSSTHRVSTNRSISSASTSSSRGVPKLRAEVHVPPGPFRSSLKTPSSDSNGSRTVAQTRSTPKPRPQMVGQKESPISKAVRFEKRTDDVEESDSDGDSEDESQKAEESESESESESSESEAHARGDVESEGEESDDEGEVPKVKKGVQSSSGDQHKVKALDKPSRRPSQRAATPESTSGAASSNTAKSFVELHLLKRKVELSMGELRRESASWKSLDEVAKCLNSMAASQLDEMIKSGKRKGVFEEAGGEGNELQCKRRKVASGVAKRPVGK